MKKFILPFIIIGFMVFVGCPGETQSNPGTGSNNDPTTDGLNFLNYQYNPDHTEDILDIYRAADEVRPAVMLIHGGAWVSVDGFESVLGRASMVEFKDRFLDNGYHVVNIDYRLIKFMSPDGTNYKDMLDDVKSAVKYIYDNSSDFKIDTSNIVMYGFSAGAHLAELYSYKVTDSKIPVKLCVARSGPANFWDENFRKCDVFGGFSTAIPDMTPQKLESLKNNITTLIQGVVGNPNITSEDIQNAMRVYLIKNLLGIVKEAEDVTSDINAIVSNPNFKQVIDDVSPITHVTTSSPKTLMLHGKQDTLVPYTIAQSLDAKLTECNVEHEFISLEYSGHLLNDSRDQEKINNFDSIVLEAVK